MRAKQLTTPKKQHNCSTNQQIHSVLHNILFKSKEKLPKTVFVLDKQQSLINLMTQIERDCPEILSSKEMFLQEMEDLYNYRSQNDT